MFFFFYFNPATSFRKLSLKTIRAQVRLVFTDNKHYSISENYKQEKSRTGLNRCLYKDNKYLAIDFFFNHFSCHQPCFQQKRAKFIIIHKTFIN